MKKIRTGIIIILFITITTKAFPQYVMPPEDTEHEGTWLQWPHHYTYGYFYRNALDNTWVEMTAALVNSEKVHIVAYNEEEKQRITTRINDAGISMANIDFYIHENDDVWVRDNGPMFVYDTENNLTILDWNFNGWGYDAPYSNCNAIPSALAAELDLPVVDLSIMVLEGGAVEHDGNGTLMATRSSVTHPSRNPELTEAQIENYLANNMGISKFIWLDGVYGSEITDMHIDGFVKFANDSTIVTFSYPDLAYWELSQKDIDTLLNATNTNNQPYNFVTLPLTQNNVETEYGYDLGYKGSYCNYYIANTVVLVPNYNDPNDSVANSIIQNLHPNKNVVGIDVRNLYEYGGMVHCVTQQQPKSQHSSAINTIKNVSVKIGAAYPNPANQFINWPIKIKEKTSIIISVYNLSGQKLLKKYVNGKPGLQKISINTSRLEVGAYICQIMADNLIVKNDKLMIKSVCP